jgi:hypothetical protein
LQGFEAQAAAEEELLVWVPLLPPTIVMLPQRTPEKPGAQLHENPFTASMQVAPFWQGLEAHSFMFVWQRTPE